MVRLVTLLFLLGLAPSLAAESAAVSSPRMVATLVTDTDAVAPGRAFRLALRLRMTPGWHTYWQNPGDAGQPPELALTLPPGSTAGALQFPAPVRLEEGPVTTYAYNSEVLLAVRIVPGDGPLHIEATATWLVCEKICVPEEGRFTLDLPAGTPAPSAETPLFAATDARIPRPSPFAAAVAPDGTLTLRDPGLSPATVKAAWFFPMTAGEIDQGAAQDSVVGDGLVRIALKPGQHFAGPLQGVAVLRDPAGQESALQIDAPLGPAEAGTTLPQVLLFALLGGALLNLMPCVFPVLAMKAIGLARMGTTARAAGRGQALAYTVGVIAAFVGLGLALLAAREAGAAAGWGFQFQSPVFVASVACVLFAVGLNLSGVFEVGAGFAGAGEGLAGQGGLAGSFFTGLLAVLVATPCTAPFMGAAIAAAVALPPAGTMTVFAAMGLGLALPYLLLGFFPGWARFLPRPGAWMDVLRGLLAFPMYAAVAWLGWVLGLQAGPDGVLALSAALVLLALAGWAFGLSQRTGGRTLGRAVALVAVVGAAAASLSIRAAPAAVAAAESSERFTPSRLAALLAEGRPVFVNMTAAWCVTCLVNEKVALSPAPVRAAFERHNVAYLKGDWTSGDKLVTAFLREHARDGVPLYVLYRPGAGPVILPQILTESGILAELNGLAS